MNKFIVCIAVIVVCASAHSPFNHLSTNPIEYSNDGGYGFYPHIPPCAYQISVKSTATFLKTGEDAGETDAIFTVHGTYFRERSKYKMADVEKVDKDVLIRPDLTNSDDKIRMFNAEWKDTDKCVSDWISKDDANKYVNNTLDIFLKNRIFDKRERGEFKGKKYVIFSSEDVKENHTLKFYTDDDNYIFVVEETFMD